MRVTGIGVVTWKASVTFTSNVEMNQPALTYYPVRSTEYTALTGLPSSQSVMQSAKMTSVLSLALTYTPQLPLN